MEIVHSDAEATLRNVDSLSKLVYHYYMLCWVGFLGRGQRDYI